MKRMIEHVAIRVTDIDKSIAFYRDIMGFKPVGRRHIAGGEIEQIAFRVGEDIFVLFHSPHFQKADEDLDFDSRQISDIVSGKARVSERKWRGGMDHVAFCMEEAEYRAVLERCRQHGVHIHRGEEKNLGAFGVGYATYFYDPDNIELEIKRYDDPPERPGPEWYASGKAMEAAAPKA
ncbi:MAG: VOC family protein [Candidatus Tectomicrobia bacterium]|uniref:VOC family protein n=1 Tax=Tectimicrobiota bacterium TaxID=2528274 RepID=A0A932HY40_UNCTE|nr:VOC family protein [Candidatus Tectomicrobia bacterium]